MLNPGETFVDVGANLGWFTVLAAKKVGRAGMVWAFEPEERNYELLGHNLRSNALDFVATERAAVGLAADTVSLYRSAENLGDHRTFPSDGVSNPTPVAQVGLSDYFGSTERRLDVVKIDCQGAEAGILAGFWDRWSVDRSLLILEYWPFGLDAAGGGVEPLLELLDRNHNRLFVLDGDRRRLLPTSIKSLRRRAAADLHPSTQRHVDLLVQPRQRGLPGGLLPFLKG